MEGARAAAALLVLAACLATSAPAPVNEQTALDIYDAGAKDGCYYNFQHYGEGDRIMTNEPCLNCTCHNRMLMCYLRVCPFTKPVGQDCTIEKRGDQCCPVITCPDVHVDLLTSTSTTSPAEYGSSDVGHLEKYGCTFGGKFFSEGSKMPSTPNKPCELCYCIRNMTACVMQECTLHVDGCTPVYHKDVCCPVRYSCDHPQDEIPMLDDLSTTVRPTTGFLLTTTVPPGVTQDCVHQDEVFADGALIKTEKACEHCYCMKGDIVCVVQECGTPMENEGKNCTSMQPREGQCCPDTYICEGDTMIEDTTNELLTTYLPTQAPTRRSNVEGSGEETPAQNAPFATTLSPLTEEEKEGSGFESGDGSIEETSDGSLPEPSVTFDTLNTNIPDSTTEPSKTLGEVSENDVKLPKKDVTPITEKPLDKESLPTVTEEPIKPISSVTFLVPETTEANQLQETTKTADKEVTPKILDENGEPEKEIGQSSTPESIVGIESTEKQIEKTAESVDAQTTEKYLDKETATMASQQLDQTTEKLNESTDIKYEQATENFFEPTTIQEINKYTTKIEEFSTNKPIDITDEHEHSTMTIPEDTRKNLNEISTTVVDETATKKSTESTSNHIDEQTTEEIADVTSENEQSTQKAPEISTVKEPTEKATEETNVRINEQSTEKAVDDSKQTFNEQATEKLAEVTNIVFDEQSTENLPEKTTENIIAVTSDEFREGTTVELPKDTSTNIVEIVTEKVVQETTETVFEHPTETATEDVTNKLDKPSTAILVDETSEPSQQPAEKTPEEITPSEHATETTETSDRLNDQSTEKSADQTSENVYDVFTEKVIASTSETIYQKTDEGAIEHAVEHTTENIAETVTEKLDTNAEKGTEVTTEYDYEKFTTRIVEHSTKNLEETSTAKSADDTVPQTTEDLDKQSTQKMVDENIDKFEESTEVMDRKSTEIYNIPSTEGTGVQSTQIPDESFTESYLQPSTGKDDQLTEKVHEVFTENTDEPSTFKPFSQTTEIFAEHKTTASISPSEQSSYINIAKEHISSTEGYIGEGSGEPTSAESTERIDDLFATSSIKPLDENKISEPISSAEKIDQSETSESTPTEFTDIFDYSTSKVNTEKTETSQTDNIPETQDNDFTKPPVSIIEDIGQTKVTSSDSFTPAPATTENTIHIETEEPQTDDNGAVLPHITTDDNVTVLPHGTTSDTIESSSESNPQVEKEETEVSKQESEENQSTPVIEQNTQTESTLFEIETTGKPIEITTHLPTTATETTVKSELSHVPSEPTFTVTFTESLPEIPAEPTIPTKEATEADKEKDNTKEDEGTLKPDQGIFTAQSEHSTLSPEQNDITTEINILSSSTSELIHKESSQPTTVTEGQVVTTVSDVSENVDQGDFTSQSEHSTLSSEQIDTTTEINILSSSTSKLTDKENLQPTTITEGTAVTAVPDESENEIHEDDQTIGHILPHIPGEGDCLVDGKTYTNDSIIPSANKCQSLCKCVSSIVKCDQIQCSPPPENMINCQPMYDAKESCCPTYVCDHAKETVAPESHNQMLDVTTELASVEKDSHMTSKPALPETPQKPQCDSDDCQAKKEVIVPVIVPECSSGSCDSTQGQSPVPHRSSDENVPSEENNNQTPDCSSGVCSQEPPITTNILPSQENVNIPVIPVVIGVPEECNGDVCTPTRKDSGGQSHVPHDTSVTELPVSICSGEECQLGSGDCKSGNCEEPLKQPLNTSCSGDKCDLPKSPELLPNGECKTGDCNESSSMPPELQPQDNTQCAGDGCIDLPVPTQENDCHSGSCENPIKAEPESINSGEAPCEGNCDASQTVVPDTSLNNTCKDGQCELAAETTTAAEGSTCTGDGCDSGLVSADSPKEQCNGSVCQKPISKTPEITTSIPCEGDTCGTPQITELQTIIPEACINGDCRGTDNITPPSQQPIDIPCDGDKCVQQSAAPGTDSKCKTEDCKPQTSDHVPLDIPCHGGQCDIQKSPDTEANIECKTDDCKPQISEIPVQISCVGDLCNLPPAISQETTLGSDCKEGDCKEKAETQKTEDAPCTGTECLVAETPKVTKMDDNEATSTIVPLKEAHTTQENVELTTKLSIEITTLATEDNESENKVSTILPNLNDVSIISPTEHPETIEKETTSQTSIADNGSAQTESTSSTDELFTTPSDTKLNEIPTDLIDKKMTTVNLPETDTTQSEVTKDSENKVNLHDMTTLQTLLPSTEKHTHIFDDEIGHTDNYKKEEIDQQTEGKNMSAITEEPTTEIAKIDKTTKYILEEPTTDKFSTAYIQPEQTTFNPEIQSSTVTENETEGMQHQTVEPVSVGQHMTTDESSGITQQETTTAYSVELEQHTHIPDDEHKPIEQETSYTPEQVLITKVEEPELTTTSILREKDQPEVQSHTIDANVPSTNIEPETENIQTTISSEITATEKTPLIKPTDENTLIESTTTSEIANLPEISSKIPIEISTDETTSPTTHKYDVGSVTEKQNFDTSDNIENVDTTSATISVTESETPPTDSVHHISENESKPVTDISEPVESSTPVLATGQVQSQEFVTSIKPDILKEPVEGNTESSTIGAERDITETQDITESSEVTEDKTIMYDHVTEIPDKSFEITSLGSGDENLTEKPTESSEAEYPESSTIKSDDDNIVTVLPVLTSTSSYAQNTNAPIIQEEKVSTETSEVVKENDVDRATTIKDELNVHTTQLPIDLSNKVNAEGSELPESIEKYTSPVPTSIITDMPLESGISVTDNAMPSATEIVEEPTSKPEQSNEIPKEEDISEEDKFTTVSGSKLDEQPEPVTYKTDSTPKSEGESLESIAPTSTEVYSIEPSSPTPETSNKLPFGEEGSGQTITSLEHVTTDNVATSYVSNASTQSPFTIESQDINDKQSTISTDLETVKFEMTTLFEPTVAVTNENTTPAVQRVRPDATTEHITDKISNYSDRFSTTQGLDTSKLSSEQTTEQYEQPNLTTIANQLPTTLESIVTNPEPDQEPIRSDEFDTKPTTSLTEATPGEVSSVTAEQTNVPTTPKVDSEHELESVDDSKTTVQPPIVPDVQSNVDLETEKPDSDEKIQTTTQADKKPAVSDELPVPSSPGELPSPSDDADHQSPDRFPSPGYGGAAEQDYEEEDQAFGPGTCRYGGKVYVSAQQIPRDDPCDFCFCFRSDIICLQQSCPPPIHGCHEEPISGFCCPRYECPVSMATTLNVTTTTTTTTTTLPPHFPSHAYKGAAQRRGCHIKGHSYQVGEVVRASSGPCLHCTCGGDGQMKCDPKVCTPEPMLRQMIAAAVSTKRRR